MERIHLGNPLPAGLVDQPALLAPSVNNVASSLDSGFSRRSLNCCVALGYTSFRWNAYVRLVWVSVALPNCAGEQNSLVSDSSPLVPLRRESFNRTGMIWARGTMDKRCHGGTVDFPKFSAERKSIPLHRSACGKSAELGPAAPRASQFTSERRKNSLV